MPYADYQVHLAKNRERQKTARGAANHAKACRAYRQRNKLKYAAHVAVNNALRDGRLQRQPCWVCGEQAEAHHPDYSQPLDVVWLCPEHHKQVHNRFYVR